MLIWLRLYNHSPLDPVLVRHQSTRNTGQVGVHEFDYVFKIIFATAEICLSNLVFAFSTCSAAHLSSATRVGHLNESPE